jgi:DNA-directed RNA polymerase subunit M/transcription elongation factor TFIIS
MGKVQTGGRCPKCGGNLYLDRDYNGWYEQCLQCAYMKDLGIVYQDRIIKTVEPVRVKKEKKDNSHNK